MLSSVVLFFAMSFVVGLSGAMMPGSMLALVVAETRRHGAWTGPLVVLGHMALEMALVAGLLAGLATLLRSTAFLVTVSLFGGGMLGWMGISMLRSKAHLDLDPARTAAPKAGGRATPILGGIVTSLANPYFILWWAGIGVNMIAEANLRIHAKWLAAGTFFTGHILSDFAWYGLVSFSLARGRRFLSDRVYALLLRTAAVALVALAVHYAASGCGYLCGAGVLAGWKAG